MDIVQTILTGIFTLVGALGGVALGYFLNWQQQSRTIRLEYTRSMLRRMISITDQIEMAARNILIILIGHNIGLPKPTEKAMKKNMNSLTEQLLEGPYMLDIPDE